MTMGGKESGNCPTQFSRACEAQFSASHIGVPYSAWGCSQTGNRRATSIIPPAPSLSRTVLSTTWAVSTTWLIRRKGCSWEVPARALVITGAPPAVGIVAQYADVEIIPDIQTRGAALRHRVQYPVDGIRRLVHLALSRLSGQSEFHGPRPVNQEQEATGIGAAYICGIGHFGSLLAVETGCQ